MGCCRVFVASSFLESVGIFWKSTLLSMQIKYSRQLISILYCYKAALITLIANSEEIQVIKQCYDIHIIDHFSIVLYIRHKISAYNKWDSTCSNYPNDKSYFIIFYRLKHLLLIKALWAVVQTQCFLRLSAAHNCIFPFMFFVIFFI